MKLHLQQISDATEAGRYAVVRMDNAGWHGGTVANDIENLSIIHLPAYSPELNPVELVWQWLRQRELANRRFANYEDIVEQLSRAWNSFRGDVERVKSMCFRGWINLIT